DPTRSHFLGGILGRMEKARLAGDSTFAVWGSGRPVRDVVYVVDVARALMHLAEQPPGLYNVSDDEEHTIGVYAAYCQDALGYNGTIVPTTSLPDGQSEKYLDVSKIAATSWAPKTHLATGLQRTIEWMRGGSTVR
ncbi:MAG: NAD-dependent epimerase/dehydratase family protein, partial [Dehalococcoidia bacterium]|nr:NAD-dependent epimerase/dehydratase family protein [Dehalococcoidia bacterium]